MPGISQREAVRVFERLGYCVARQNGHIVIANGKTRLVIPRHNPINAMTMGGIAKDAGLTPDQFHALLSAVDASRQSSRRTRTSAAPPTTSLSVER